MPKLKEEEIVERWSALIPEANGRGKELFRRIKEIIKGVEAPKIEFVEKAISPSLIRKLKGEAKTFLVAQNTYLEGYLMYIGASDYGKQLFVSWYLTLEPGGAEKFIANLPWWAQLPLLPIVIPFIIYRKFRKKAVAPPDMDILHLEELTAYVTTGHHAVIDATREISQSVNFDFTKVDTKSRGFLNIS